MENIVGSDGRSTDLTHHTLRLRTNPTDATSSITFTTAVRLAVLSAQVIMVRDRPTELPERRVVEIGQGVGGRRIFATNQPPRPNKEHDLHIRSPGSRMCSNKEMRCEVEVRVRTFVFHGIERFDASCELGEAGQAPLTPGHAGRAV